MTELRQAILIGSTNYNKSPLEFPLKDVEDFSNVLLNRCHIKEENICKIKSEKNSTTTVFNEIKEICTSIDKTKKNILELIVFYYSGHGFYDSTSEIPYLKFSDEENVSLFEILEEITKIKAKNKYIIIDACQVGGLTLMNTKSYFDRKHTFNSEGLYCLFGASSESMAFEPSLKHQIKKNIQNSYYTHFIIECLNTKSKYEEGTISIKIIDDYSSRKTPTYTNFAQVPFSTTQVAGYLPFGFWDVENELDEINFEHNNQLIDNQNNINELYQVNYIIDSIKSLFNHTNDFPSFHIIESLKNLSAPAIDLINRELDLERKKINGKPLINGLLSSSIHEKFLYFILAANEIKVNLNLKDNNGRSIIWEIINNESVNSLYLLSHIFKKGYKTSFDEYDYLTAEIVRRDIKQDNINKIGYCLIYYKLTTFDQIQRANEIEKILLSILSLKYNRVIGYNFKNITSLINNFFHNYSAYSDIYIKALKKFNNYETILNTVSIKQKIDNYLKDPVYQEVKNNDIICKIIPELNE